MRKLFKTTLLVIILSMFWGLTAFAGLEDNVGEADYACPTGSWIDGCSYTKTGYILSLTTKDKQNARPTPTTSCQPVVVFYGTAPTIKANSYTDEDGDGYPDGDDGDILRLRPSVGGTVKQTLYQNIAFNIPPFNADGSSNREAIRNWLVSPYGDEEYGVLYLIKKYWGIDAAKGFIDSYNSANPEDCWYFTVETVFYHGYYKGNEYMGRKIIATPRQMASFVSTYSVRSYDKGSYGFGAYDFQNAPNSLLYDEDWMGLKAPTETTGRHDYKTIMMNAYGIISLRPTDLGATVGDKKIVKSFYKEDASTAVQTFEKTTISTCAERPTLGATGYTVVDWKTSTVALPTTVTNTTDYVTATSHLVAPDPKKSGTSDATINLGIDEKVIYVKLVKVEGQTAIETTESLKAWELNYIYPDLSGVRRGGDVGTISPLTHVGSTGAISAPSVGSKQNCTWTTTNADVSLSASGGLASNMFSLKHYRYSSLASNLYWNESDSVALSLPSGRTLYGASYPHNLPRTLWGDTPTMVSYRNSYNDLVYGVGTLGLKSDEYSSYTKSTTTDYDGSRISVGATNQDIKHDTDKSTTVNITVSATDEYDEWKIGSCDCTEYRESVGHDSDCSGSPCKSGCSYDEGHDHSSSCKTNGYWDEDCTSVVSESLGDTAITHTIDKFTPKSTSDATAPGSQITAPYSAVVPSKTTNSLTIYPEVGMHMNKYQSSSGEIISGSSVQVKTNTAYVYGEKARTFTPIQLVGYRVVGVNKMKGYTSLPSALSSKTAMELLNDFNVKNYDGVSSSGVTALGSTFETSVTDNVRVNAITACIEPYQPVAKKWGSNEALMTELSSGNTAFANALASSLNMEMQMRYFRDDEGKMRNLGNPSKLDATLGGYKVASTPIKNSYQIKFEHGEIVNESELISALSLAFGTNGQELWETMKLDLQMQNILVSDTDSDNGSTKNNNAYSPARPWYDEQCYSMQLSIYTSAISYGDMFADDKVDFNIGDVPATKKFKNREEAYGVRFEIGLASTTGSVSAGNGTLTLNPMVMPFSEVKTSHFLVMNRTTAETRN